MSRAAHASLVCPPSHRWGTDGAGRQHHVCAAVGALRAREADTLRAILAPLLSPPPRTGWGWAAPRSSTMGGLAMGEADTLRAALDLWWPLRSTVSGLAMGEADTLCAALDLLWLLPRTDGGKESEGQRS